MSRFKTTYYPGLIDPAEATALYEFLRDTVLWTDGIWSKRYNQVTRKGCSMSMDLDTPDPIHAQVMRVVTAVLQQVSDGDVVPLGVYLNYYQDGNEWAPSHRHQGMVQLIISLGAQRKLIVGTKPYIIDNGDVIIFGGATHELVREPDITEGRISIATFMVPI